ncbi:MAG: hypothetical protein DRP12_00390 [Candidatus Aenigmatarchaeota archaeon]|nr:MAG: hypothetical protein DRP12_00390 [Candidatus Aenigmarchaeota archaeon]
MEKINVCGLPFDLTCKNCKLFQNKECSGCRSNTYCQLPKCAKEKGVNNCFECTEFPCKLLYEKGPIVKELLDFFKENLKKS